MDSTHLSCFSAQKLQILIGSSCHSCPDALVFRFFREEGWKKTQHLCCRVIRDDGIHAGTMLKNGNMHTRNSTHISLYSVITSSSCGSRRPVSIAANGLDQLISSFMFVFFWLIFLDLKTKNRLFSDYVIKQTWNLLPRLEESSAAD